MEIKEIKSLDILSVAKFFAVIGLVFGFLFGLLGGLVPQPLFHRIMSLHLPENSSPIFSPHCSEQLWV